MAGLADLLLNPALEQIFIYGIIQQLLQGGLQPFVQALSNAANAADPQTPISPADAALAVVRTIFDEATGAAHAAQSGVPAGDFATLVAITGDAPAPEQLAEALRRGFIDEATYERGVLEGRLRNEWIQLPKQLAVRQPSPEQAAAAAVEGQLSFADAQALYAKFGGDPTDFQLVYNLTGSAPSPVEAGVLANRGVIPWTGTGQGVTSFQQAVFEGHSRDKWLAGWQALAVYLPPPRTITAMHTEGSLTDAQAADLLTKHGLSSDLVTAYLQSGTHARVKAAKELSESTIHSLYTDVLIGKAQAITYLGALGYTAAEAPYIVEVWDDQVHAAAMKSAVSRVHSLFVAHKITPGQATADLTSLGVPATEAADLMTLWGSERAANVRDLTPAQVEGAWYYNVITTADAIGRLEAFGYSAADAMVALEVRNKGPLTAAQLSSGSH